MSNEPNRIPPAPKSGRFKTVVAWVCGPIVLLELIAFVVVWIWAWNVTSSAPNWVSMAKLLVGGVEVNPKLENGRPIPDSFFGTSVELMHSSSVLRGAEMRMHALHPDLKPQPCRFEAARVPGANIIVVRMTGAEPAYVMAYLDAVMDEFIAKRKEIRAGSGEGAMIGIQDELVRLEKEMLLTEQKIKAAEKSGTEPEELITLKAKSEKIKSNHDRLIGALRQMDTGRSDGDSFAIIEHASRPVLVVPQFSIFKVFK